MIQHSMRYVAMAEHVAASLPRNTKRARLLRAAEAITDAEIHLVEKYGEWREAMKEAAAAGSPLAQTCLDKTVWDLT